VSYSQNYGNLGYALAHPLGSNFEELLVELKWQRNNWFAKNCLSYFLHGADKDGYSYGGDIYKSYNVRPYEYGHKIGQGTANNGLRALLIVGYTLESSTNLQVYIENRIQFNTLYQITPYQVLIGIRSSLWNDYRNY
jgi:hypothetical protein